MKKFILAFMTAFAALTVTAGAEGLYRFDNSLASEEGAGLATPATTVSSTLGSGGAAVYDGGALKLDGTYGLKLGSVGPYYEVSAKVTLASSGDTSTLFFKNMGTSSSEKWLGVIFQNGVPNVWSHDGDTFRWAALETKAENCVGKTVEIKYVENMGSAELYVDGVLAASGAVVSGGGDLYLGSTYWSADALSATVDDLAVINRTFEYFGGFPSTLIDDIDIDAAGAGVNWISDHPEVISAEGKVTRPAENTAVTLTGTKKMGPWGEDIVKTFDFTVLKAAQKANDNMVLSYVFDENTVDVVEDRSGNGNHGKLFGGKTGSAFDGVNDYVELPRGMLADLDEFTIVMRLKNGIVQTHQFTFCFGNGTNEYFFLNTSRPNPDINTLRLALTNNGSDSEKNIASLPGLRDGETAALAVTVSGTEAKMYKDGVPIAAGNLGFSPSELGDTADNWLAKSPYNDPYFKGEIYEFTIYPRALDEGEIRDMHYSEPEEVGWISDAEIDGNTLTVSLNRFCMVSAVFFDNGGNVTYSTTSKVSGDDLTAVFALPKGEISNVELAAYDPSRGVIKDRLAVAAYGGVAVYSDYGGSLKLTNTTDADLNVTVMAAGYNDGALTGINAVTEAVPAGSYVVADDPSKEGDRLLVWYSLDSLKPVTRQK